MDPRLLTLALLGVSGGLVEAYCWLRLTLIRVRDRLDLECYRYERRGREKYTKIIANWVFDLLAQPLAANSVMALDCWVNNSREDIFSTLPDEIISFIMSSLPPREAVRTSVLSKRLRHVYASLPHLNFDSFAFFMPHLDNKFLELTVNPHFCICATPKLVGIVDRSLKSYPGPKISSFRISFCYKRQYARNVDRWISWAIQMGVEKLDLEFVCFDCCSCDRYYDYTITKMYAFYCERLCEVPFKLKHLRLHSCILLPHPLSWRFTSLTTLDLNYISLGHGELYDMLSSCLNLEWLGLRKCTLPHKVHISGLFSLAFLSIISCKDVEEIEVSAVNLTTLELADMKLEKLFFCVPKLKNIHLSSYLWKLDEQHVLALAKDLPQIEILTFFLYTPKVEYIPTTFSNVLQLNLFVQMEWKDYDFAWSIIPLLRAFPLLQKLYLKLPSIWNVYEDVWRGDVRTPRPGQLRYSLPQLREVNFVGFHGTKKHIESAVYVLENAVALELMIIDATYLQYVSGKWFTNSYFSTASLKRNKELFRSQLHGKNISKKAKVIIKPGEKGDFLTRELIARVW